MLKVTSISSRHSQSHHSRQRLSGLVGSSTESGIFSRAMDNDIVKASEQMTLLDDKRAHPIEDSSETIEPANKRIKVESTDHPAEFPSVTCDSTLQKISQPGNLHGAQGDCQSATLEVTIKHSDTGPLNPESGESSIVTSSSQSSHASASNISLQDAASVPTKAPVPNPTAQSSSTVSPTSPVPQAPEKATTMKHLREKYLGELEYMLREFRKLERQLLGAKGAAQLEESAGSKERREKLHSFILHLEDTVRQIDVGCAMEEEGIRPAIGATPGEKRGDESGHQTSSLVNSTKDDEESVQKLEEHILANLLPVKIRLKKQLAAQQGATRNPPGMPAPRRGSLQPATLGKGTFAAAAEERRKQAEAARLAAQQDEQALRRAADPSQFGKPLKGGGSTLTQKLHGATLGSKERTHGHGVGSATIPTTPGDTTTPDRKILYAGMVPMSTQHQSSIIAASGVHDLIVEDPNFIEKNDEVGEADDSHAPVSTSATAQSVVAEVAPEAQPCINNASPTTTEPTTALADVEMETAEKSIKPHENFTLSGDERKKLRKQRRKRKLVRIARRREKERQRQLALQQQAQAAQGNAKAAAGKKKSATNKPPGKKKGPKSVEYMCALCSETYNSTCDYNPWWALSQHECPKCRKTQIPRIDISAPANAIDYHPALLAHAEENNGVGEGSSETGVHVVHITQPSPTYKTSPLGDQGFIEGFDSDSESDLSELSDGSLSEESLDSDDSEMDFQAMSQAEQAEHECFGHEYKGPVLSDDHASRLLVLMSHASTCPCRHKLTKHRDVCMSTKFMMLHVRDCPGTTSSFDICPFPWCRKVKHLLYHLVSCVEPETCTICSPKHLSDSLRSLSGLNDYRLKKYRQSLLAAAAVTKSTKSKGPPVPNSRPVLHKPAPRNELDAPRPVTSPTKSPVQRIGETIPTNSASVAHATTTSPSMSTPPVKTSLAEPTANHQAGVQNFDKAPKKNDGSLVSNHPSAEKLPKSENIETQHEHGEHERGEMLLDEVQGAIAASTSVDDDIAEVLANEDIHPAMGEEPGFEPVNMETTRVMEPAGTSPLECNHTSQIVAEVAIKIEMEEALPIMDREVEKTTDPINESALQSHITTTVSDAPLILASSVPTIRATKEEREPSCHNCTCPPGELKQCEEPPSARGRVQSDSTSLEGVTETRTVEQRMSTQPSNEVLRAC